MFKATQITPTPTPTPGAGAGARDQVATVASEIAKGTTEARRAAKLAATDASAGLQALVLRTATTKKAFQSQLAKLTDPVKLQKQQTKFNQTADGIAELAAIAAQNTADLQAANDAADRAAQESADREAAILAERQRVYNSFLDSVKNTFASIKNSILGAFDLRELGGSTNAITRNMEKMLVKLRSFSTNVAKLSGLGLNSALLQQVISAGPMGGARLAEALVMGGAEGLAAINAGYSEFGSLAGQIATTGTNSLFNREAQQTVYNINVDGGVGSGSTIGKAIVDAIKAYERTSGAVWQGA
jgi:hypothetical protein